MRTRASAMVGRDAERRALSDVLAGARSGRGGVVVVRGPAGVGKSRLVAETVGTAAAAGMPVLRGRAGATGLVAPLRPFSEALAALQRRGALPGPDVLDGYHAVLARVLPDIAGPDSTRLPESPIAVAEAVLRVLIHTGRDHGCALVLEDMQGADDESLAIVEYLVDNIADVGVAVLITVRDGSTPASKIVDSLQRRDAVEALRLAPLGREDTDTLAASCLGCTGKEVPADLLDLLWSGTAGDPLQVEELLYELVETGHLVSSESGWRLVTQHPAGAPSGVERSVQLRIRGLDPQAGRVLAAAALLGDRFPVELVHRATGLPQRVFLEQVQAAVRAQLVTAADRPDWYAFQHPLIRDVALRTLSAAERRAAALALADVVVELRPRLPEGWRAVAADLYDAAGHPAAAVNLLVAAGRRALDGGNPTGAVPLLERAVARLAGDAGEDPLEGLDDGATTSAARALLVRALIDVGYLERARELVDGPARGVDADTRSDLHLALAWAFHLAGLAPAAHEQLAAARLVSPATADPTRGAHFAAVAANLALDDDSVEQPDRVEELGRDAAAQAARAGVPEAACRAWHAVARVTRLRDLAESSRCFDQLVSLARAHELRGWVVLGLVGLAGNAWLGDGDAVALDIARRQANTDGAVQISLAVSANIALDEVLRGQHAAGPHLAEVLAESERLGNGGLAAYATMGQVVHHAHAGDRAAMTAAAARLAGLGAGQDAVRGLAAGLGEAVLDLLESEDERAHVTLTRVADAESGHRSMFQLAGTAGLLLLLDALRGTVDVAAAARLCSTTRGRMRWNRQFGELAVAVAAGHAGDPATADHAVGQWHEAATIYPLARHLAVRLVAEHAARDGWGEPVPWLREAEEWFHQAGLAAPSRSCRSILRRLGEQVGQRRDGAAELPADARRNGITVREFEVYGLVLDKHGNKAIAERLHISPRTVEKHIASLLAKYGVDSRDGLVREAGRWT